MADRLRAVKNVESAHIRTINVVQMVPAWPVMFVRRRNKMIPKMFEIQGKNTPFIVPSVRLSDAGRMGD